MLKPLINSFKYHPILSILVIGILVMVFIFPILIPFIIFFFIALSSSKERKQNKYKVQPNLIQQFLNPPKRTDKPSNYGYLGIHMSHEQKVRYMCSPKWRQIKNKMLSLHSCCEHCGSTKQLQIHHNTYERLGNESLSDLNVLCSSCHSTLHKKAGYSRLSFFPISILKDGYD